MVSFTKNQQSKNNATRAGLRQRSTKHSSENRSSVYSSDNSSCSSYIVEEDDQQHYVNLNGQVIFKSGEHRRSETIYSETENESPNSKIIVDNTTQLDNDYDQSYEEESSSGSSKYVIMGCLFAVLLIAVIATCIATKKHKDENDTDIAVVKGNSSDASAHANQSRSCCCCAVLLTVGLLALTGAILGCAACCCGWCCCEDTATDAPSGSTCAELEVYDGGDEYNCPDGYIFDTENAELVLEVTTLDNFQVKCCAIVIEN